MESVLPNKEVLRSAESRFSFRIPQCQVLVLPQPAIIATRFGDVDPVLYDKLDEKLIRYKEVEELYEEIMKTMVGEEERFDADTARMACPPAPHDSGAQLSLAFLGQKIPRTKRPIAPVTANRGGRISVTESAMSTAPATSTTGSPKHGIRMLPRTDAVTVTPDEFAFDRRSAMSRVPSSKLASFKYNFAGYVPILPELPPEGARPSGGFLASLGVSDGEGRDRFSSDDYFAFLRRRHTDALVRALGLDEPLEAETDDVVDEIKVLEDLRKKAEEEQRMRRREKEKMMTFHRGSWNVQLVDYLGDMAARGSRSVGLEDNVEGPPATVLEPFSGMQVKPVAAQAKSTQQLMDELFKKTRQTKYGHPTLQRL